MPSEQTVQTLSALRGAIDADAFDTAEDLHQQLIDGYDATRGAEAALREQVVAVRERLSADEAEPLVALTQFVQTQAATAIGRTGVLVGTRRYLIDPASGSAEALTQHIADLRSQEETFLEAEAAAAAIVDDADVELPATLVVTRGQIEEGPHIPAVGYELATTVENVGGAAVDDVDVGLDLPEGINADSAAKPLGSVKPGGAVDAAFTVMAEAPGDYTMRVVPSGAEDVAIQSNTVRLAVLGSSTLAQQALEAVQRARQRINDSGADEGRQRSLVAKLDAAGRRIRDGQSALEDGEERKAEDQFRAAARVLGAFLNSLDTPGTGKQASNAGATDLRSARRLAENAIELLASAREA